MKLQRSECVIGLYTAVVHRNCIFHCRYGFLHVLTEYQVQETGKAKEERGKRVGREREERGREERGKRVGREREDREKREGRKGRKEGGKREGREREGRGKREGRVREEGGKKEGRKDRG